MHMNTKILSAFALALVSILFSACVGDILAPKEDPTEFYVLKAAQNVEPIAGLQSVKLNISLAMVPTYMKRNQIVTSLKESSRIDISEINRWPETPVDSFTRVIALNIAKITKSKEINTYPSFSTDDDAIDLRINVMESMGEIGGNLNFSAKWELLRSKRSKAVQRKTNIFEITIPTGDTYDSYVMAIEKALYELSLDIAKNLNEFKAE